jgi:broad specificity phosphatase PhoE
VRVVALVRHGEDLGGERMAARGGAGLSARGRAQARAAGEFLAPLGAAVCCSPVARARETAEVLSAGAAVRVLDGLAPLDLGDWEGARADAAAPLAEALQRPGGGAPGGETLEALRARATVALDEARETGGHVVVVAHRMTNAVLLADALGLPPEAAPRVQQDPGAVSLLLEDRGGRLRPAAVNLTPLDPLRIGAAAVRVL